MGVTFHCCTAIPTCLVVYFVTVGVTASPAIVQALSTGRAAISAAKPLSVDDRAWVFCNPFWSGKGNMVCVDKEKKYCFKNQGCSFPRIPESPKEVNTSFILFTFTPENPLPSDGKQFYPTSNLREAIPDFDSSLPLIFIIHGWG